MPPVAAASTSSSSERSLHFAWSSPQRARQIPSYSPKAPHRLLAIPQPTAPQLLDVSLGCRGHPETGVEAPKLPRTESLTEPAEGCGGIDAKPRHPVYSACMRHYHWCPWCSERKTTRFAHGSQAGRSVCLWLKSRSPVALEVTCSVLLSHGTGFRKCLPSGQHSFIYQNTTANLSFLDFFFLSQDSLGLIGLWSERTKDDVRWFI